MDKLKTAQDVMDALASYLDMFNIEIYKKINDADSSDEDTLRLIHGSQALSAVINEIEKQI